MRLRSAVEWDSRQMPVPLRIDRLVPLQVMQELPGEFDFRRDLNRLAGLHGRDECNEQERVTELYKGRSKVGVLEVDLMVANDRRQAYVTVIQAGYPKVTDFHEIPRLPADATPRSEEYT